MARVTLRVHSLLSGNVYRNIYTIRIELFWKIFAGLNVMAVKMYINNIFFKVHLYLPFYKIITINIVLV